MAAPKENAIITRSHYGNLQFLHAMGSEPNELPSETKRKIMIWLDVMYKLARGGMGIDEGTPIQETALREFFRDTDILKPSDTLWQFLLAKTPSYVNRKHIH
jgi:hypothetical protein